MLFRSFFDSEIGRRILCSEQVWREFRFSLMTDVRELLKEETEEEKILLQGVVDCCFLENGELVLLDYNTDGVFSDSEIKERSEHYRIQLETYAGALERIFGCRVKERWLYFLRPETAVALT